MHLHLVGIGGSGVSAIAKVLLGSGYTVSGSDIKRNSLTESLVESGATVFRGHRAGHIAGADALIVSSAVPSTNPEVQAAVAKGIPVLKRADVLGQLMRERIGIAVAGTHGKTTTTAMIAHLLIEAGLDPTVVVGGILPSLGTNGRHGSGDYFVVEADEYDHMFLGLRPEVIIITSLEHDHPDLFPTKEEYVAAFREFVSLLPSSGHLIACLDDEGVASFLADISMRGTEISTYGTVSEESGASSANVLALDCRPNQLGGTDFLVEMDGQMVGLARLRVPGLHNVRNALAAIIVALELEIPFDDIRQSLAGFGGVGRRFQVVGEVGGITVIDDFGHHPTEIKATLAAARQRYPGRRLWAVWQPHTYSRTRLLRDQFAASFADADQVVALDIYRSRENNSLGIDTADVVATMKHPKATHISGFDEAAKYILERLHPDDVILTLSAGDGNRVGNKVLDDLRNRIDED
jgi:UDP-N-acetylmuramate--alanine ligase